MSRVFLAGLGLALLLGACSGGQAPQPARILAPQPAVAELHDGLIAHYNLLPTLALNEAVARQYGITRSEGSALLLVALRQRDGAGTDELPAQGQVLARASNLSGQHQELSLREAGTGDYTDHIGLVRVSPHDVIRIQVTVQAKGRSSSFGFERVF